MSEVTRRGFLKGAGLAVAGAAVAGMVGCSTAEASQDWMPERWDDEADLIIVGYGGAGALAAIAGLHEGASCIVLEKSAERDGGSTGCSGGHMHTCVGVDVDEWAKTYVHGSFGAGASEEVIRGYMAHANETPEWMETFGIDITWADESNDGHKRPKDYQGGYIAGRDGIVGMYLFEALDEAAEEYGVDVRLSTPAKRLIQNPLTKEIIGVVAEDGNGQTLNFKANKAVIMACGGYENNPQIQYSYNNPGVRVFPWGTPHNTGDGIPMVQAVGANIWHMHALEHAALCYMLPSIEANCSISTDATDGITPYNYCIVDYNGNRFMKEDKTGAHDMDHKPGFDFDGKACDYLHLPMFLVFDQTMYDAKPLWEGSGRAGIINTYAGVWNYNHPDEPIIEWGTNDNAVEKGWIFKGETIEELAKNIKAERPCHDESEAINGIDGAALAATIEKYNSYCEAGKDPDFNRDAKHMLPLNNPPYYAIELGYSSINTQGGPERNENCQAMDPFGEPIPRLYSTGEFGSYNAFVYDIGNILEAITTGRVAAQHAVTLEPWDASK
ncbi:FAD-dependent oxidoreductase [Raoultibacter massiliensis]|uniref:FAD-dependent oxidoreductase n=1 Tax=Raoultibacter massiliensis TaxID=1852371 RepID=UPI003A8E2CA8